MKLRAYIFQNKLSITKAAHKLGVPPQTVHHWIAGFRIPRKEHMVHIYRWSKGQVQPNDFYDLEAINPVNELPLFSNGAGHGVASHG